MRQPAFIFLPPSLFLQVLWLLNEHVEMPTRKLYLHTWQVTLTIYALMEDVTMHVHITVYAVWHNLAI